MAQAGILPAESPPLAPTSMPAVEVSRSQRHCTFCAVRHGMPLALVSQINHVPMNSSLLYALKLDKSRRALHLAERRLLPLVTFFSRREKGLFFQDHCRS